MIERFPCADSINSAMQPPPAAVGAPIDAIDTPALVVDLDAFERNVAKMAALARASGVALRPHAKTHKCPAIALAQTAAGAVGQCCQKVGEAEALVEGGVRDVLVSNEVVGEAKLARLAALATRATVALCFDAAPAVAAASRAAASAGVELGALIEVDVGMQRCGVAPGVAASELARRVAASPGLRFRGIQAYHGAAQHLPRVVEREAAIGHAAIAVRETLAALDRAGMRCEVVSGAGTGTFAFEAASGLWSELQAGSYVFMDTEYARIEGADGRPYREFEHSLFVLATVMSVPCADRAIVDAGLKSYSAEKGPPWVRGRSDIEVVAVSDEHGRLAFAAGAPRLALGDKLMLIPGHCDPTVNLHDWYVGVRGGRVEALWPITARGASH
jgi:D-serine deaminase-like pyridoxal phosphate-dependent protein